VAGHGLVSDLLQSFAYLPLAHECDGRPVRACDKGSSNSVSSLLEPLALGPPATPAFIEQPRQLRRLL
jgi:hypothetical protein